MVLSTQIPKSQKDAHNLCLLVYMETTTFILFTFNILNIVMICIIYFLSRIETPDCKLFSYLLKYKYFPEYGQIIFNDKQQNTATNIQQVFCNSGVFQESKQYTFSIYRCIEKSKHIRKQITISAINLWIKNNIW